MASMIRRRRFLEYSALAALPAIPAFAQRPDAPVDVVVIGAGLAGMRAAQLLRKAGLGVAVLEARTDAGGRVRTVRAPFDPGLYGEAGPIRIPPSHRRVLSLVREYNLSLIPFAQPGRPALVTIDGVTARANTPEGMHPASLDLRPDEQGLGAGKLLQRYLGTLPDNLGSADPSAADYAGWAEFDTMTWHAWLRARGASPGAIRLMTLGGDSRELSALYVLRQIGLLRSAAPFDFKIKGGMDLLARGMAKSLEGVIRYGAVVTALQDEDGAVRVVYEEKGQRREIRASQVVIAIPFSTLRQVEMRVGLTAQKRKTIAELPYFPAVRFLLQSRSRFWTEAGLSGQARTDRPVEIWDCAYDAQGKSGLLGVNGGGSLGRSIAGLSEASCTAFGVGLAADAMPKIRMEFQRGVTYRWASEPWSLGAFSVFYPNQMASMMPGIAQPEGRLHFAGEHTASWMGWMEGALQSGERAAEEITSIRGKKL